MKKPSPNEYPQYYSKYIDLLQNISPDKEEKNIFDILIEQNKEIVNLFTNLDEEKLLYKYEDGKWSMKEVLGHLIDSERIFGYRALCIARNEEQNLPCFNENEYVNEAKFNLRNIESLLEEFKYLRNANILLFYSFDEIILTRKGIACNNTISLNALIYIMAGHTLHHLNILKSKYLK